MNNNKIYSNRHDDQTEEEQQGLYSPFVSHIDEITITHIPEANKRAIRKLLKEHEDKSK